MPAETLQYDDAIVRKFVTATIAWGTFAALIGLWCALELAVPQANVAPYFTFGRLWPLFTNAVILAFAGNAVFAAVYYASQRLLDARPHAGLSRFHFWGWQAIGAAAAITLPLGLNQGRQYAELEWPIELAIAVVWIAFAVTFFTMLRDRRHRRLYVSLWFFIASIVAIAILQVSANLVIPVGAAKSYPVFAGVQDAFVQVWYGDNTFAFLLVVPFLGIMYYFLPKAAARPLYSYRLAVGQFWALVLTSVCAVHYAWVPWWASTLGMVFGILLWVPAWGGMVNGLLTLRGVWSRAIADPVLRFFIVGLAFLGIATLEGSILSIKSIDAALQYTDWTASYLQLGALGWVAFVVFGMIYWLVPRLHQTALYSRRLAIAHFWLAATGLVLYVAAMWASGIAEGLMRRAFDTSGHLMYPDFVEMVTHIVPMYWVRVVGAALYAAGLFACAYNVYRTWRARPATYAEPEGQVPLQRHVEAPTTWHQRLEASPLRLGVLLAGIVFFGSLFEVLSMSWSAAHVPKLATIEPYTPLELYGRDIYIREGCASCHSQMVRPLLDETVRYGLDGVPAAYSEPGEMIYDHPSQWGRKRIGPDLAREGGRHDELWQLLHFEDPRAVSPGSVMPAYPRLASTAIEWSVIQRRVDAMAALGVPYDTDARTDAVALARTQADHVAELLVAAGGPKGMQGEEVVAVIAYLQRLGRDVRVAQLRTDPAYPVTSAASACDPADPGTGTWSILHAWLTGAELPAAPTAPEPPLDAGMRARGAKVFATNCTPCHGARGDGKGPLASLLGDPPANFTTGVYTMRTTDHEELPTDTDLFVTITRGIHGTAMPPWFALPERDRWALVAYLKSLSTAFSDDTAPPPIAIGDVPAVTPERIAHGKTLFATGGCASCHGEDGRGDGPVAPMLRTASGAPIKPRDFTAPRFHRGSRLTDLYTTVVTGFDGTPMGSFAKVMAPDDLWDVVMYVQSLAPTYVDRDGLRCPSRTDASPDELVGIRSLMSTLHPPSSER